MGIRTENNYIVGCDGEQCKFQWFHHCVRLDVQAVPYGDWVSVEREFSIFIMLEIHGPCICTGIF